MPTYREALSANPTAFVDYAAQMTAAGADLTEHRLAYGEQVASLNMHWQDEANTAFNTEVDTVGAHIDGLASQTAATAGQLSAAGAAMETAVTVLKGADAAIHAAGFDVQPAPQVVLSAAQRVAIAMAGPFGFQVQAALEATALAATTGLQAVLAGLNSTDAQAAAALSAAAGALQPLGSKTSSTGEDMRHLMAEDHSGAPAGEEAGEEEAAEEEQEPTEEEEAPSEQPEDRQQPPTQPQTPQQPTMPQTPMPQTPSGLDDLQRPELDDPWADTELPDPEDLSGGLASGAGGLGAGSGFGGGSGPAGGLASSGPATAPTATGLGAMSGAAPAATVGGTGRTGAGSSMMGGGGGRGAGKADDETTRESKLTEDPEDDVWGIGGGDDDPYA
ncbi:hypothetical protein [Glycomyces arizonensis]|uniref:hypothetical protein n=1 Tax=Glycomyces arizonensis TaxID=256035 RepID=UPI00041B0ADA|nr:hypothetical protein [Glycomyces arizonensis]